MTMLICVQYIFYITFDYTVLYIDKNMFICLYSLYFLYIYYKLAFSEPQKKTPDMLGTDARELKSPFELTHMPNRASAHPS